MKNPIYALAGALALGAVSIPVLAQDGPVAEPGGPAGKWAKRTPVTPDPSKIQVPDGIQGGRVRRRSGYRHLHHGRRE